MVNFLDWFDANGFWTDNTWDIETGKWVGSGKLQLFPYQRRVLGHCFSFDADGRLPYSTVVYSTIKKSGKALALGTIIPTVDGVKTMGDISVGDFVFNMDGDAVKVEAITEIMYNHDCFEMEFSNGQTVVADADHLWYIRDRKGGSGNGWGDVGVKTTRELSKDYITQDYMIPRKVERLAVRGVEVSRSDRVVIRSIKQVESVPVKCIQVEGGSYLITTSYIPTHNSKVAAAVSAWVGETFEEGSQTFICANDLDQALNIVFSDVKYHTRKAGICEPMRMRIEYPNGNLVQATAQQYSGAAGSRHVLSVWDELWAYQSQNSLLMWAEMTPPPTIPNAFRLVVTYAGYENQDGPLRSLYDDSWVLGEPVPELSDLVNLAGEPICRKKAGTFIMWDDMPRMPWQTDEYYEDQMTTLRPEDFLRQHRNQWVSGSESFIPSEQWDRCVKLDGPILYKRNDPKMIFPISIGVDIGIKHDCSAAVGVGYDNNNNRPFLAFHRIWTPQRDDQIDLENTVERFLLDMWTMFNVTDVTYDPMQFHRSATTLQKRGVPMIEFPQTDANMISSTQTLYDLIRSGGIDLYPDEELRDHVLHSPVKHSSRGIRIQKSKNAKFKIDAAIALVMATFMAVRGGGRMISAPLVIESPFADNSSISIPSFRNQLEAKIPEQLRTREDDYGYR